MMESMNTKYHRLTTERVCKEFSVDPVNGLSLSQVNEHSRRFGKNALTGKSSRTLWSKIAEQFEDYLVQILLASACVSFILAIIGGAMETDGVSALVEPVVILLILIANASIAIIQDNNSEKALDELTKLQPVTTSVIRGGKIHTINAEDLVPGDIIELRVGDKAPADSRVLEVYSAQLRIEQSSLTGENVSVDKDEAPVPETVKDDSLPEQSNMIFGSTTIVAGRCKAIVTATGMNTQIGKIQEAVIAAEQECDKTPLGEKLDEFGHLLAYIIAAICVIVWVINFNHFFDVEHGGWLNGSIYYFKIAVSLAVAAIPEGLLGVITTCLALGTRKMTKRNAIVRNLPSVETLGCTTVICSDKTGTLTTNEMSVQHLCVFTDERGLETYDIEGNGFEPYGMVTDSDGKPFGSIGTKDIVFHWLSRCCALCNYSYIVRDSDGRYKARGEPTEAALRVLVEKLGCPEPHLNDQYYLHRDRSQSPTVFCDYWEHDWRKLLTLDFDRSRKSMSDLVRRADGTEVLLIKGAPESVLERSTSFMTASGRYERMNDKVKADFERWFQMMASRGLRTIALGMKTNVGILKNYNESKRDAVRATDAAFIESDIQLLAMIAMRDPPRREVPRAIQLCREAGIKVHMITGDHKRTAEAVGRDIGVLPRIGDVAHLSFTGHDLDNMSNLRLEQVLRDGVTGLVFSRMEPKHKQVIIRTLKEMNEVIAMTGDGVNDAPALKSADIGIAMGITGSAVAKESSDMVLADDNFGTIVAAVEEGRNIYNNMKAFIRYLISSNIGEVASIFITAAIGVPEGLSPVQLLWVNLVTDGPPATALGFNPADVDVMKDKPRRKDEPLVSTWVFVRYMIIGIYVGLATVLIFIWYYCYDTTGDHTLVSFTELKNYSKCPEWTDFNPIHTEGMSHTNPCSYFTSSKKANTLSLSVLVTIEMMNALNAISENHSLFTLPPWHNPWLVLAITGSLLLHTCILYVGWLSTIFGTVGLTANDWKAVLLFSAPVILIDEVLKLSARHISTLWVFGKMNLSKSNSTFKDEINKIN